MQKDWLEDLVVRETMKLIQDDAVIDKIVQLIMDVQNQENTTIPLLEKQLREVNKKLDNLMKAIEDGLYTRTTKEHRGVSQQFGKSCCRICIDWAGFGSGLLCAREGFRLCTIISRLVATMEDWKID